LVEKEKIPNVGGGATTGRSPKLSGGKNVGIPEMACKTSLRGGFIRASSRTIARWENIIRRHSQVLRFDKRARDKEKEGVQN